LPEGDGGDDPPLTATSPDGGDQGQGPAVLDGGGNLLFAASSPDGNESLLDRLRLWLSSDEGERTTGIPNILRLPPADLPAPPSEEPTISPQPPVSGLAALPSWSQAALLSAGVSAVFFLIPLLARWVWNLPRDE
jgi:hypothetical protein